MTDHVLIQLAVRRPHVNAPTLPEGATYDTISGCWQTRGEGGLTPMSTKKNDIETGEDMKGE
ncbi:hypothetical protein HNQ36_003603 [Afipia massiliensis]|jgi:hypothetical protein|uniref:Uncharacterized protein n=1 Tax=Afipia massiliensis TaxID=211460 RepID=A0A840N0I8_9BRAD|nr:hypothetical protein [Afipia massiliensis]WIG52232.1 MAG: hypothetical protein OJF48_003150 [Afipia sp.]